MCYIVFSAVCLVCSGVVSFFFCLVSQNNEEAAECGASRRAEGDLSLRHCLHLNVNSYI